MNKFILIIIIYLKNHNLYIVLLKYIFIYLVIKKIIENFQFLIKNYNFLFIMLNILFIRFRQCAEVKA
jgi:hypothetical protein